MSLNVEPTKNCVVQWLLKQRANSGNSLRGSPTKVHIVNVQSLYWFSPQQKALGKLKTFPSQQRTANVNWTKKHSVSSICCISMQQKVSGTELLPLPKLRSAEPQVMRGTPASCDNSQIQATRAVPFSYPEMIQDAHCPECFALLKV